MVRSPGEVFPFGRRTRVRPMARREHWRPCEVKTWKPASVHAPRRLFIRPIRQWCTSSAGKAFIAPRLDQFYTLDHVAAWCLEIFARHFDPASFVMVEPSAGGGSFLKVMPDGTLAFDLKPMHPGILNADYLAFELKSDRPIATVGNPPFGPNASLARKFFNHAARHSDVIAMILPRSFLKARIENSLNTAFHLVYQEEVEPDAFEHHGVRRHVGTVFQLWERRAVPRARRMEETSHPDFEFVTPDVADFAIRRVGANAGEIRHDVKHVHVGSHYFIRGKVEHIMRQLDLKGAAGLATSTPSLAISQIVELYRELMERAEDSEAND